MTKQEKFDSYCKAFDLCCKYSGIITKSSGNKTTFTFNSLDNRKNVNKKIGAFDCCNMIGNLYRLNYSLYS